MRKYLNQKLYFLALFALLVLVGRSINFSAIVGTQNQFFTVYQFFGPLAGKFLGTTFGVVSVLAAEIAQFAISGKEWNIVNLVKITPMLFAAFYFGSKKKLTSALIPAICMLAFWVHPIGREAWPYALYWLIPIAGKIVPYKNKARLFLQSFGATFTAHAVGSVLFLYTIPMTSAQWLALIPVVAFERLVFGSGIAGSYIGVNYALGYLNSKLKVKIPETVLRIDKNFELTKRKEAIEIKV